MYRELHVSIQGNDYGDGTNTNPFHTISKAAQIARPGDTVIVHEGTYREWVKPKNGGTSALNPIIYKAAEGEKVIIKGSERIDHWELIEGSVWKCDLANTFFGNYNPYDEALYGDWFVYPEKTLVHPGEVYLNGKSFYEAASLEAIKNPTRRESFSMPLSDRIEYLPYPEDTLYQWYCEVSGDLTTIYANFQGANPNTELTEINVRQCCFYPEISGLNYITVKGFEMSQAATPWTPPTADQPGLLGAHWSKGWIIEDNIIHDSKCSAISIGKDASTGHNLSARFNQKSGYQHQLEAVFKGLQKGWSKETIGSHIVRNNSIYDCGQNGIVGHMGCAFSEIYNNHIYNIGVKHEYFGWEIAGIKFHAPIDVHIHNNNIHHCTLGLWLDWQAQGTRVSNNILYKNERDCTLEVTHGPLMFDNNILASSYNFDNHAQGTAFINNLFCGTMKTHKILDRSTPYHYPHTTQIAGCALVFGGDERIYNNLYVGTKTSNEAFFCGTAGYNGHTASYEEYLDRVINEHIGDDDVLAEAGQPVYADGNVYLNGAEAFDRETHNYINKDYNPTITIIEEGSKVYLEMTVTKEMLEVTTRTHSTHTLGFVRIADAIYDDPNGKSIVLDKDYFGNKRAKAPSVGPFEGISIGVNRLKIWG